MQVSLIFLYFLFGIMVPTHQADGQCSRTLDLVFVVDGSNSLGEANYNTILSSVSNAVNSLVIGPTDTRVGVVVYSKNVTGYLDLQTNSTYFKERVVKFEYPDETTATDKGIMKAVDILMAQNRNASLAIMIITDGESDNRTKTKEVAELAKAKGISIWGIGVGKGLDMSELYSLASNGQQQTLYIEEVNQLSLTLANLTKTACIKTQSTVCSRPIDLVFVIDGSNSLGESNFRLILDRVSNAVKSLVIGPNDTRVGAVLYSKVVGAVIPLQTDVNSFITALSTFGYPDETTATDLGIIKAVEILTSQNRGVPMDMLIITDGESDNRTKTKQEAEIAKKKGISIWGVGIGGGLDMSELDNLATNGSQQTFYFNEFNKLTLELETLTRDSCISPPVTTCSRPMDFVFVIDGSNSLGEDNFQQILHTVADTVNSMVIGPTDTRVGAVLYSKNVPAFIELQTDAKAFISAVLSFQYPDETTATDLGIKKAVEIFMAKNRNAPMAMMIITDGESDNRTKTREEANKAKAEGISIWGIGVGKGLDMSELYTLATNGSQQSLLIENFDQLSVQLENLARKACDQQQIPVCRRPIDLVFVIDGSNSLGEANFKQILDTVSTAVNSLTVGVLDTHVGAVLYSKVVNAFISLQSDANAFRQGVLSFQYPDETTATDLGIKQAVDILTAQRRNVPMIMLIITDGESDNRTKTRQEADYAKAKGINIWGVGVGKGLDMSELVSLATNGQQQTFYINDFNDFSRQLQNVTAFACQNLEITTTPKPTVNPIADRDVNICYNYLDLVIVMDGSNSVGVDVFYQALADISNAVSSLELGENFTKVGAVVYGDNVTDFMYLQSDSVSFRRGLTSFKYPDTSTATAEGLKKAIEILDTSNRVNVSKAIMLVTDGYANQLTRNEAEYQSLFALSRGIDIWGLGVGRQADIIELMTLTRTPEQAFQISSFEELSLRLRNITKQICQETVVLPTGIPPTTPAPTTTELTTTTTTPTTTSTTTTPSTTTSTTTTTTTTTPTTTTTTPTTTTTTTTPTTTRTTTTTPTTITTPTTTRTTPTTTTTTTTPTTTTTRTTTTTTTPTTTTTTTTPTTTTTTTPTTTTTTTSTTTPTTTPKTTPTSTTTPTTTPTTTSISITTAKARTPMKNPCDGGQYIKGVAHLPYPGDCTKLIQCYFNPLTNKTLAVIRRCPLGQFWDQKTLECALSWKVQCPFDKCRAECELDSVWDKSLAEEDGAMTYAMVGSRRGYYACHKGKAFPKCCPRHTVYVRGIGCQLSLGACEKCGPEETCPNGVGFCQNIPIWENPKSYQEINQAMFEYPVSCIYADFDIVDCRCGFKTLSEQHYGTATCSPYFLTNETTNCTEVFHDVPIWRQKMGARPVTLKFALSLSSPEFHIDSTPEGECNDSFGLKIWGDSKTINVDIGSGRRSDRSASRATVLWQNATGDFDVQVVLHKGLMTLVVAQGRYEIATTVEAELKTNCHECDHSVKVSSSPFNTCALTQMQIFHCAPEFNSIYKNS